MGFLIIGGKNDFSSITEMEIKRDERKIGNEGGDSRYK